MKIFKINPHDVGRVFQNVTNLMTLTLILNQWWTINLSHNFKLRHRKKVLENFRKFISQERHIRILI